jgi:O-methyltransferase involved in polyketide biosynthesis
MGHAAKPTRQNRTITVDFHDETTYAALLTNGFSLLQTNK